MTTYSTYLIQQATRVAELLEAGFDNRAIAEELGVSKPRISQIRAVLPDLREYLGQPEPTARLKAKRQQLWELRHQALRLAASIRRDLRELDEELEAVRLDRTLGLRG